MGTHPVAFLDVFAERPLAGNGLAVVDRADAVDDEVMLAFARETRLSETTFVQSADEEGADYRNRILTPAYEIPFAGHPSLGTAVAVARWRGETEVTYRQQTGTGIQPVEVGRQAAGGDAGTDESWRASMLQGEAELGQELDPGRALAAVGLDPGDADPGLPPQLSSTGLLTAVVPVVDESVLARADADHAAIGELIAPAPDGMLYLVHCRPAEGLARARSFASAPEVAEDPATGSSAGAFCAYLAERAGSERVTITQGVEMGRPSRIEAEMDHGQVRVSGSVIPLLEGTLTLP